MPNPDGPTEFLALSATATLDKIQNYKSSDKCHDEHHVYMSVLEVIQRDQVIQPGIVVGLMLSEANFGQLENQ